MVRSTATGHTGFRDAAQSLKLYRRAELKDDNGERVIEDLYVDPLPNEHVLQTLLKPNTTFLIGRKGTGKSTIFQRAQSDLRKRNRVTTAYVDIKSVYESSRVDPSVLATSQAASTLPKASLEQLLLNRQFVSAVIHSIKDELNNRIESSLWERVKATVGGGIPDLFSSLEALLEEAMAHRFESVLGTIVESRRTERSDTSGSTAGAGAALRATGPELSLSASVNQSTSLSEEIDQADVLMRVFDLKKVISRLREILRKCGIDQLYVFIDDFSEMPEPAMRLVVDVLLAPLNNWSDELIKFKVAAYPTRIYYGAIDPTKIDEVSLDLFDLYGGSDVGAMEEKAIDFTRRLVTRRLTHYQAEPIPELFDSANNEVWRQIFYATMANPRNVGYLLYFAYENALLYDKKIGSGAIRSAAQRYYEEKIEAGFEMNRFLQESFAERSSIFSLKDLLDAIVDRARALKKSDASPIREVDGAAPTSHFHLGPDHEPLLRSLELNFFITKYCEMRNRDGRKVAVYALNYGLCQQQVIEFGRPTGKREQRFRQYFVGRPFDFTPIFQSYIRNNQEIICDSCGHHQELEALPALRAYGMLCPECRIGQCNVINLSRKYEPTLRAVEDSALLPQVELGILQALATEKRELSPSEVAGELDCSYQLVGRRAKNLDDRGLVDRERDGNRRVYRPTPLAEQIYFDSSSDSASAADES